MSIQIQQNLIKQVDGSATFQFSRTKVISSVTGPIEVSRPRNLKSTKAYLSIQVRPAIGLPSTNEISLERKLNKILMPLIKLNDYPRCEIQIIVQILETNENDQFNCIKLSCAINSIYLSLINANIHLNSSFLSSFSCCINDEIILRPDNEQLNKSKSHNISVFSLIDGKCDELIYTDSLGNTNKPELFKVLQSTSHDIQTINSQVRESILESVVNDYVWKF